MLTVAAMAASGLSPLFKVDVNLNDQRAVILLWYRAQLVSASASGQAQLAQPSGPGLPVPVLASGGHRQLACTAGTSESTP